MLVSWQLGVCCPPRTFPLQGHLVHTFLRLARPRPPCPLPFVPKAHTSRNAASSINTLLILTRQQHGHTTGINTPVPFTLYAASGNTISTAQAYAPSRRHTLCIPLRLPCLILHCLLDRLVLPRLNYTLADSLFHPSRLGTCSLCSIPSETAGIWASLLCRGASDLDAEARR